VNQHWLTLLIKELEVINATYQPWLWSVVILI